MTLRFADSWAIQSGDWKRAKDIAWSLTDWGPMHGAILVERLRTFATHPFHVEEHVQRMAWGAKALHWIDDDQRWEHWLFQNHPTFSSLALVTQALLDRNRDLLLQESDVGIVWLISPGDGGWEHRTPVSPSWIAHLVPLPWRRLDQFYRHGSPLVLSPVRNVSNQSWPIQVKSRNRLHYYLADRLATQQQDAVPLLLNEAGLVTESSIANVLMVDNQGRLVSPVAADVLAGVSMAFLKQLAHSLHIECLERDITWQDLESAEEILLAGTTAGVWRGASIEGRLISDGQAGPVLQQLQAAWKRHVALDFEEQAAKRSQELS